MQRQETLLSARELEELPAEHAVQLLSLLEAFSSPDGASRTQAFTALCDMDAHRRSPLVACIFCHSLREPDLSLRCKILKAITESMQASGQDVISSQIVCTCVAWTLRRLGRAEVTAILRIAQHTPSAMGQVCSILNACSHSGELLVDLLVDRQQELALRQAAIVALGEVGFLEAFPVLERMEKRMAEQSLQQFPMPFAAPITAEAQSLLPVVRQALAQLAEAAL